ncbi:hypothetical protein V5O48_014925 [Marasmius crinis-equi]|uniref:Uncharacterized protein n=1 Tax=Marasmius crinis-equi TaxID=585013 RepID=A0ABR3EVZ6_9AGAR
MKDLWHDDSSAFYSKATDEFYERWGMYPLNQDLADAKPGDFALRDVNEIEDMDERNEEIETREKFRRKCRQKILSWANNQWGNKKAGDVSSLQSLLAEMRDVTKVAPRKMSAIHFYQSRFWEERLKEGFDEIWVTKGLLESARVREMNAYCHDMWKKEPQEFKDQVTAEVEQAYKDALEVFNKRGDWDQTALSYYEIWQRSREVLPVITDAIGKLFGGGAAVFVFAPSATDSNDILIKSCTALVPATQTSKPSLHNFDKIAYKAATSLCLRYGQAAFSNDFRRSRLLSPIELEKVGLLGEKHDVDDTEVHKSGPDSASIPVPETQPPAASASDSLPAIVASTTPTLSTTLPQASSTPSPTQLKPPHATVEPASLASPIIPAPATPAPAVLQTYSTPPNQSSISSASVVNHAAPVPVTQGSLPETQCQQLVPESILQLDNPNAIQVSQPNIDMDMNEMQAWLASADISGLYPNMQMVIDSLINATPEDLDTLAQNPYYQYRETAMNAVPYDNPMFWGGATSDWGASGSEQSLIPVNHNLCPAFVAPGCHPSQIDTSISPSQLSLAASATSHMQQQTSALPVPALTITPTEATTAIPVSPALLQAGLTAPVLEELPVQTAAVITKPAAEGKENGSSPAIPSVIPKKPTRKRKTADPPENTDSIEPTEEGGTDPKPKRRRAAKLPADPQDLIAIRKPGRNASKPLRFIEEHSDNIDDKAVGSGKKKSGSKSGSKAK